MVEPLSNLIAVVPAILPSEGVAAATPLNGAGLDLSLYGADRVLMVVTFGPITAGAVTSIKAQVDSEVAFGDSPADIAGSAQTVADNKDDLTFLIDVINPPTPFVRLGVSRGTQNAVIASAFYLVYGVRNRPVTQPAGISGKEVHRDKATGTA